MTQSSAVLKSKIASDYIHSDDLYPEVIRMPEPLLRMTDIKKKFPGVQALSNASLELFAGEILGLMGENGAGKSTLMNILGGVYHPDEGKIQIDGNEVAVHSVLDAQNLGIAFIHQELAMVQHLTVAENIFLGREKLDSFHMVSQNEMNKQAKPILETVGLEIDPKEKVSRLSTGQQQLLEIAKAFSLNARIIVMDEPTSSLSEKEVEILFKTIRQLKEKEIGIIYISHKMQEIFDLTDRVTVMRDGSYIGTRITNETNPDELVELMVGRELEKYYIRTFNTPGDVILDVQNIHTDSGVHDCSFQLHQREILGFYGLVGAGRSELMNAVMGLDSITRGNIFVFGKEVKKINPGNMLKNRLALVPESRKTQGLILENSIRFNTTIAILDKFINKLQVNLKKEKELSKEAIEKFSIRCSSSLQKCINLSGGNQQKVVLAKWLLTNPGILIMDEPTRGIDVGAKAEIYAIMNKLVADGNAIIMVSSELTEIINMCDRLFIMRGGTIVAELSSEQFDQDVILRYALGGI